MILSVNTDKVNFALDALIPVFVPPFSPIKKTREAHQQLYLESCRGSVPKISRTLCLQDCDYGFLLRHNQILSGRPAEL